MTPEAAPDTPPRDPLVRLPEAGWLGGVCAGIGLRIDLDPLAVRLIAIILTIVTGGLGAVLYLVAWAAMSTPADLGIDEASFVDGKRWTSPPGADVAAAGSWGWRRGGSAAAAGREARGRLPRSGSIRLGLGVTLITLGILLACRELGLWLSDAVVWPLVIAAGGAALIMRQIQASGEPDEELERGSGSAGPEPPAHAEQRLPTPDHPGRPAEPSATSTAATPTLPHDQQRSSTRSRRSPTHRHSRRRLGTGLGIALILGATTLLLFTTGIFSQFFDAAVAVAVIAAAAALVVTPFLVVSARRAQEERRQRIRSEERAEVAAHLHDSVLQTLALIQRQAGDSPEVATLARRQERELREWLSGRTSGERATSLAAALEAVAAEVEGDQQVQVDVVTVGDRELDRHSEALVAATREAINNAARFSTPQRQGLGPGKGQVQGLGPEKGHGQGQGLGHGKGHGQGQGQGQDQDLSPHPHPSPVSVYAELGPERASVFVRDRGPGFDPDSIPPDRRGVRESILGRMERHGGKARIRSQPGEGTEVELTMEFT